jgi:predicted RNA binding protein YcfA (HicA-like mRNA interferase family)
MTSAELIRELRQDGWHLVRARGSHHIFHHPKKPGAVIVPHPKKDLGKGLVAAIRRQAGLKES